MDGVVLSLRCREAALLLLSLHFYGCTTWRPTTVSPRQVIEEEQPQRVRVTGPDGTPVVIEHPVVRNDSIATVTEADCRTSVAGGGRFNCREVAQSVMPLSEVDRIEVRGFSGWRTVGMIVLVSAIAYGAAVAIALESYGWL